ncbi:hypothetical protein JCM19233_244 [Vibrio astriarenae]|nr:hypothetical protein JCM19233_244 [Vibrio sp. C7]
MNGFVTYFKKIQWQVEAAKSLDALIVWRQRANIGGNGLSYKTEQGRLVLIVTPNTK